MPPIYTINFLQNNDILECIVKPYLLGYICHCTNKEDYKKIIESGYIKYSDKRENCRGYKQKLVCLADFRDITKNKEQLDNIMNMIRQYIFILKKEEYENIIPSRTEAQYWEYHDEGYLIPEYECWYKDKITLDKIEKIYKINTIQRLCQNKKINDAIINKIESYLKLN